MFGRIARRLENGYLQLIDFPLHFEPLERKSQLG
jgi:hypothetical protein